MQRRLAAASSSLPTCSAADGGQQRQPCAALHAGRGTGCRSYRAEVCNARSAEAAQVQTRGEPPARHQTRCGRWRHGEVTAALKGLQRTAGAQVEDRVEKPGPSLQMGSSGQQRHGLVELGGGNSSRRQGGGRAVAAYTSSTDRTRGAPCSPRCSPSMWGRQPSLSWGLRSAGIPKLRCGARGGGAHSVRPRSAAHSEDCTAAGDRTSAAGGDRRDVATMRAGMQFYVRRTAQSLIEDV